MLANLLKEEQLLEKKRHEEGCEFEEEPMRKQQKLNDDDEDEGCEFEEEPIRKRQKVKDDDEEDDDEEEEEEESVDEGEFYKDYSAEDDGYEDYSEADECSVSKERMGEGCYVFSLPTNEAIDNLCKSFSYADVLPSHQVRARIQDFLKILSEETNAAEAFVRVSKAMKMCLKILIDIDENRLTPEGLHRGLLCYKLRSDSPDYFSSRLQVNRTIQDVVVLLRCSPYSLGIGEYGRGVVAGRISIQEPDEPAVDYSTRRSSGYAIPSDLKWLESLVMKTDARCIIVLQRREVFDFLASNRAFKEKIRSILLTAGGYPNTATRLLLHRMSQAFPDLPILALVDWKPAGLAVLSAYKFGFGSTGMGIGAYGYACNVKWVGLRGDDLKLIPDNYLRPLNLRDLQIAESLISSGILEKNYRKELELMMQRGVRADVFDLFVNGFDYLPEYVAKKIEQADYI